MTGPREPMWDSQQSPRPSEDDLSSPLRRPAAEGLPRIERVFPIRVVLPIAQQAVQNVAVSKSLPSLEPSDATRDTEAQPGKDTEALDSKGQDGTQSEESTSTSVPLVSTWPPSEDSSIPNKRYVTNKFEYVAGQDAASSPSSAASQTIYRCEDEPIHIPGAIQRFGTLIAIRETAGLFLVRVVSDNSNSVVGLHPEKLFGLRCFTDLLASEDKKEFLLRCHTLSSNSSASSQPDVFQISLTSLCGAPIPLYCAMHLSEESNLIVCEFELEKDLLDPTGLLNQRLPDEPSQVMEHQATEAERSMSTTIRSKPLHALQMVLQGSRPLAAMDLFQIIAEIQAQLGTATELTVLLDQIVGLVYELTGFHRVMVYKFDETAAGSVVSEMVNARASTDIYRGLHFPASDIPKQARDLYLVNTIRVLYDRDEETSRLICRTFDDAKVPLDLRHSYLRAMSPVHLRYLANIGVQASMSISLTVHQKLWGLVSCHNYGQGAGMRISLPMREVCRALGSIASSNIEKLLYAQRIQARRPLINAAPKASPFMYITSSSSDLLNMFGADFGFLVIRGEARTIGKLASYSECIALLQYIRRRAFSTTFSSDSIEKDCPDLNYPSGLCLLAGMLVLPLSLTGSEFLVFFRRGREKEIHWAGNPYGKTKKPGQSYLEPRSSFKRWIESVKGTSREWTEDQVESAAVLTTIYVRFIEVWRQKEAMVQRNRLTRLLVRNAGHEVRTPLSSIINYLEVALEEELDERARTHLKRSLEASKSLVFVVNDLLSLTEAEDGNYTTYEDNVDLRSMVSEVMVAFRTEATQKLLDIQLLDDAVVPRTVRCNPDKLRQVLSNLLANAIQYSEQGQIYITLDHVVTTEGDPSIRISFQDKGLGLSEQELDSIFQDFEQILEDDDHVQPSIDKTGDSALQIGLGLATAARFARLNHGQIFMSSEGKGCGTTVSITVPLGIAVQENLILRPPQNSLRNPPSENILQIRNTIDIQPSPGAQKSESVANPSDNANMALESASTSPLSSPSPGNPSSSDPSEAISRYAHYPFPIIATPMDGPKFHVLVAEDNPLNSRLLEMRLKKRGHGVEVAADGKACVEVFKSSLGKFDIILMDIQMPILDGIQASRLIRKHEQSAVESASLALQEDGYGRIPIIAVSASLSEQRIDEYIDAGFDGWILKPIDFKRLEAILIAVRDEETRESLLYSSGGWEKGGWLKKHKDDDPFKRPIAPSSTDS